MTSVVFRIVSERTDLGPTRACATPQTSFSVLGAIGRQVSEASNQGNSTETPGVYCLRGRLPQHAYPHMNRT
jgi:hypothetical protein